MIVLRIASRSTFFLASLLVAWPWPAPAGASNQAAAPEATCGYLDRNTTARPEVWDGTCPADCPFEPSREITGLVFTGRFASYTTCDYWYPSWANDGHLYSACGDGEFCGHRILNLGLARISGDDPLDLKFTFLGSFNVADFTRQSAYGSTSLIKDGVWYVGLEEGWNSYSARTAEGVARFWGFLCSARPGSISGELGYPFPPNPYWADRSNHPLRRTADADAQAADGRSATQYVGGFFREPPGANRVRNLHFVDFGKELQYSPDGKAYALCHGSEGDKRAEWGNGDSVYVLRVEPRCEEINDPASWEFFAGQDAAGNPMWSPRAADAKPLLTWNDKLGLAHAVYNAPLKKYLMWISPLLQSDTWVQDQGPARRFSAEGSLLLESDGLLGPWRMVQYFPSLGPNAYCICFPSKFISSDGKRAWLLCSANYTAMPAPGQPEGMRYAAHFREVDLQTGAAKRSAGLAISELGKIESGLSARDELEGTEAKWACVRTMLGADANRVIIKQVAGSLGGNTSVRNQLPLVWKDKGYYQRARDLGQVFTAPSDFALESIVLRTGNSSLAFQPGAAGAEVFAQFFAVTGTPVLDDNGTPPGTQARHGFSNNHRCDDFLTGVQYEPLCVVTGGRLPDLAAGGDGKLVYMKWTFSGDAVPRFERGRRYAFMVGFVAPAPERNFTLSNRNNAASPRPPALADADDTYPGGWGLRREGNGVRPPRMIPGESPPGDPDALHQLQIEATFPTGEARYALPPTCDGYPDVDTYRDLEFYLLERRTDAE